jgi:hypothetical protein
VTEESIDARVTQETFVSMKRGPIHLFLEFESLADSSGTREKAPLCGTFEPTSKPPTCSDVHQEV